MSFYYLAGPYSIDPERMYHRHQEAQRYIEKKGGWVIYSPIVETHKRHVEEPRDYEHWMARDLEMLEGAIGLIRLPGESPGADREVSFAEKRGIPIWAGQSPVDDFIEGRPPTIPAKTIEFAWPEKTDETILQEAQCLTISDRNTDYGHPADDFTKVVGAVNSFFSHKLKQPFEVTDWPLIMQCVKIAREIHKPKRDNRVDGAGYWNCLQMIHDRNAANG